MRRLIALSLVATSMLASLPASATDVQACLAASEKGQRARSAGKLREARDSFLICGGEGCPSMVRKDCAQWQSEVISMLPSVVLGAKDKQGRDMFDVTVSMDGEPLVRKLDGKSVVVDPGPHTFKFEVPGSPPVIERALVKEGEKTRVITVSFGDGSGTTPSEGATQVSAEPDKTKPAPAGDKGGHTIFPWIVVGLGAATVIAGAVVYATSPDTPVNCSKDTQTCAKIPGESPTDFADRQEKAGRADSQPVEGIIVGAIGVVLVGGGLLWHFLEPTGERTGKLRFTPWAAPGSAGAGIGASF